MAQCFFAHRPNVEPTCRTNVRPAGRAYVGPTCWANVRPMSNNTLGQHSLPTLAHQRLIALAQSVSQHWPNVITFKFFNPTFYQQHIFWSQGLWSKQQYKHIEFTLLNFLSILSIVIQEEHSNRSYFFCMCLWALFFFFCKVVSDKFSVTQIDHQTEC